MATTLYLRHGLAFGFVDGTYRWIRQNSSGNVVVGQFTQTQIPFRPDNTSTYEPYLSTTVGSGAGTTINQPTDSSVHAIGSDITAVRGFTWITDPLAANGTISGTISFDLWGFESNMSANVGFRVQVYRIRYDGLITEILSSDSSELGTTLALKSWTGTPTSTNFVRGDRVMAAVSTTAGNTGYTVDFKYNGDNGNSADSRITLTENLTFETSDPTGTQYWLRATNSSVNPNSIVARELLTTQGTAETQANYTTVAGFHAYPGNQWTSTAGGTAIEWYSPGQSAGTFGGSAKLTMTTFGSNWENLDLPYARAIWELAVCNSDGTNPVVWSQSYVYGAVSSVKYILGPTTSISSGQIFRLRLYADDIEINNTAQVSGTVISMGYGGDAAGYTTNIIMPEIVPDGGGGEWNQLDPWGMSGFFGN